MLFATVITQLAHLSFGVRVKNQRSKIEVFWTLDVMTLDKLNEKNMTPA